MSEKPETTFRKKVVKDLTTLPLTAIFSIQQRTIQGDPDLMICMRGFFIGLELKSANGKTSKLQEYKLGKIREAQGRAYVVFPNNWNEILTELTALARGIV
jgi:hypothetical protein